MRRFQTNVLDRPSVVRVVRAIRDGLDSFRMYAKDYLDRFWRERREGRAVDLSYSFMNSLGRLWGLELADRELFGLLTLAKSGASIPDLMKDMGRISSSFDALNPGIESARQSGSREVIRTMFRDLARFYPSDTDVEGLIDQSLESWRGRGVYFSDAHYDAQIILQYVSRELQRAMLYHGLPEDTVYHREGEERYWVPAGILRTSGEERKDLYREAIRVTNQEIRKRTWYGERREPLPETPFFSFLSWSNSAARWIVSHGKIEDAVLSGRREVRLDANEILVSFPAYVMEQVAPFLDPLPLYEFSQEAKERGEYPEPTDSGIRRVIQSILDQTYPEEDPEDRRIRAIETFDLFRRAKGGDKKAMAEVSLFLETGTVMPGFVRVLEQWFRRAG